jgi:hypothetical protein
MRYLLVPALILTLLAPAIATAQPPRLAQIDKVRVGFRPYNEQANFGRYKVGLWTPVYVDITAGQNGLGAMKGDPQPWLKIETPDFEGVNTIYRMPVRVEPNETETFVMYTKTGNMNGEIKVELRVGNRTIHSPPERPMAMELNSFVYLALGRRVGDLPAALRGKEDKNANPNQFQDETQRRAAVYEDNVNLLPRHWFGYDGVDVIILSPDDTKFLTRLAGSPEQLRALAQWVRRGGRLIVPVSRITQELTSSLLDNKAIWQLPVVPPPQTADKFSQPEQLPAVQHWGAANALLPNPGEKPPVIAQIEPVGGGPLDWDVEARAGAAADSPPLIARMRYGLGQVVYFAFSLDDPAFAQWPGRHDFLRTMVEKVGPRVPKDLNPNMNRGRFGGQDSNDITSQLFNSLDNFDVQVIPFGVVAVFIVLYVLIVGPLEFILLKYVFGRLEWTWITFPAVVVAVSVIAYFSAYALKGQDLKINKVDVVDIDLRTGVNAERQAGPTRIYGHTFMMILSPRIQSYTVGIEPNPAFWGNDSEGKPLTADTVSWMARPDPNDFGGMGRGGSGQGFFRKPYYYGELPNYDSEPPMGETLPSGVSGVPIPVWMSKAFAASWETAAKVPPVVADLFYHRHPVDGKDLKISGTLRSNLGVDLVDTWLIYGDRAYPIDNGLPAKQDQAGLKLHLELQQAKSLGQGDWLQGTVAGEGRPPTGQGVYDPNPIVRQLLLFERLDTSNSRTNHSLRRLDFSWRLAEEPPAGIVDRRTREAILVGRVRFQNGNAETLTADTSQPLATKLWLDKLPESGQGRPNLVGTLHQDTFVRMILPVRPAGN